MHIIYIILMNALDVIAEEAVVVCESGWTLHEGKCYKYIHPPWPPRKVLAPPSPAASSLAPCSHKCGCR